MEGIGDDDIIALGWLAGEDGPRVRVDDPHPRGVEEQPLFGRAGDQRVQLRDGDGRVRGSRADGAGQGVGTAAREKPAQRLGLLFSEVLECELVHQLHIRRDQHAGLAVVIGAVDQMVQHQAARNTEGGAFGVIDDPDAEVVALAIAGIGEAVARIGHQDQTDCRDKHGDGRCARAPFEKRQSEQKKPDRGTDDDAARAQILDQHIARDEGAQDAAQRGQCVHATDDMAGASVQLQCQCRQKRRHHTEQHGRHEEEREDIEEARAQQRHLARLDERRDQRQEEEDTETEEPGQCQRDAGCQLVAAAVGPDPAEPVAERQPGEDHADDGGPGVERHPDVRRDQSTRQDLQDQKERRAEKDGDAVPGNTQTVGHDGLREWTSGPQG